MQITKYTHACLVLTKNNQSLVIDPGVWSNDFVIPNNVAGVIVTHEHPDHFDRTKLTAIFAAQPGVVVYAPDDVIRQLDGLPGTVVAAGDEITLGEFALRFTGGQHATIHPDYPVCMNLGVIVDGGELYYPGDSFTLPSCAVQTLAVPAAAPWLKVSEAMDFISAVKPARVFPTHDALLSPEGKQVYGAWLEKATQAINADLTDGNDTSI